MRPIAAAALSLLLAISMAGPAGAQIVGRHDYGPSARPNPFLENAFPPTPHNRRDTSEIRDRIGAARDLGVITRREARRLERESRLIDHLARRYGRDGLSELERRELETRTHLLRAQFDRPRTPPRRP